MGKHMGKRMGKGMDKCMGVVGGAVGRGAYLNQRFVSKVDVALGLSITRDRVACEHNIPPRGVSETTACRDWHWHIPNIMCSEMGYRCVCVRVRAHVRGV